MHPELIHIGSITIYSWGFMLAIAVVTGIVGLSYNFKKSGINQDWAIDIVLYMVIGGIIGARILYIVLYDLIDFFHHPLEVLSLSNGLTGLVWYGGVAGAILPLVFFVRKRKLSLSDITDMMVPWVASGYAIVRLGCYMAGCCYGKITASSWGQVFPVVDHFYRYPTQLMSSLFNFLLALFLLWFYKKRVFSGQVTLVYLIAYALYRFAIEFFRYNQIYWGPLSIGQLISLVLFGAAIITYVIMIRKPKKKEEFE